MGEILDEFDCFLCILERRIRRMETTDVLTNVPVVIDNGSGLIKAGFAGDQVPKSHFPNIVGRTKYVRLMAGALEGDIFVGPKADDNRGLLSLRYPMEHGVVSAIWWHATAVKYCTVDRDNLFFFCRKMQNYCFFSPLIHWQFNGIIFGLICRKVTCRQRRFYCYVWLLDRLIDWLIGHIDHRLIDWLIDLLYLHVFGFTVWSISCSVFVTELSFL